MPAKTTKPSKPEKVNAYMQTLDHPLREVVEALRLIILQASLEIDEEIKWNAPAFFYTGEMNSFSPKEYKRHFFIFNFSKTESIRLVFLGGGKVEDTAGFLEGNYADGRRLANFHNMEEVQFKEAQLLTVVRRQLELLDK